MIKLSNISKSFGAQTLFESLTFNVNQRERVGLVGRNGHGKTTLFKIILGELETDTGEILIPRRYRLGHLEQHLDFTQPTVLEEVSLGLPDAHEHETWKAEKILSGLGFTERDMSLPPERFSGGYQVRLNLARVLVSEPDMLLLDEPTNYLDVVSIRWLARFLRNWRSELMLITHDRGFMDRVVTHTVGIHRKRAKKVEGSTSKLYEQILQEEEIHEKTRINDDKKRKEVERFIERFRSKNTLATRVQSRIKYLARHDKIERLNRIQTLDFSFRSVPFPSRVMLRVDDLTFGYGEDPALFTHLSFDIQTHERICIMGQNGKGKSTLLRLLARELTPRGGVIKPHPRLQLGHFAQTNVDTLVPTHDVLEEILSAGQGCLPQTARNIAGAMMFGGDHALKQISVLSGGEKSRVMLGKLIAAPSNLLLLDEPTNHLDMDSCDSLLAAVDAFDGAVIMVTHNETFLHTLATRFIVFDRGQVRLYDRSYRDFLNDIGWEMDGPLASRNRSPGRSASAPIDKKALRQTRARITQERSRVLGPLQARVTELEARIMTAETKAEVTVSALSEAVTAGDSAAIAELSQVSGRLKKEIDESFNALEAATAEVDVATAEFARRLKELASPPG